MCFNIKIKTIVTNPLVNNFTFLYVDNYDTLKYAPNCIKNLIKEEEWLQIVGLIVFGVMQFFCKKNNLVFQYDNLYNYKRNNTESSIIL